jgi:hypothetical protein
MKLLQYMHMGMQDMRDFCSFMASLPDGSEMLYMSMDHSNGSYSATFVPTSAGTTLVRMYVQNKLAASGSSETLEVTAAPPSAITSFVDKEQSTLYSRAGFSSTVQVSSLDRANCQPHLQSVPQVYNPQDTCNLCFELRERLQ